MKTPLFLNRQIVFCILLGLASTGSAFGQSAVNASTLTVSSTSTLNGTLTVSGASTFNNNLTITGWTDLLNSQLTFGPSSSVYSYWLFTDSSADTLTNVLNRGSASWLWAHGTTTSPVPAMRLDSTHQLLLFNAAGTTAGITLTPASNQISLGTATLAGSGANLTVGGALTVTSGITNTTGSLTSPTALNLTAGGTNQNITLTPSGTGSTVVNGRLQVNGTGSSNVLLMSTGHTFFQATPAAGYNTYYDNLLVGSTTMFRTSNTVSADTNALGILSNGNVGIGTSGALTKLDVKLATNQHVGIYNNGGVTTLSGLNDAGSLAILKLEGSPLAFGGAGGVEHMRIDSAGRVGIGMVSPGYSLDVNGAVHSTVAGGSNVILSKPLGASIAFDNNAGVQTALIESGSPANSNRLEFWTNTSGNTGLVERMRIDNAGNVGIGTTTPGFTLDANGQIHAHYLWAGGGYDGRIYLRNAGNTVVTYLDGATGANSFINNGGNFGIGTTSPTGKLDVLGSSATNAYTAPADQSDLRILSSQNRPLDGGIIEIGGSAGATGYIKTTAYNVNAGAMVLGTRRNPYDATMQPSMTLDQGGNVGIGTTSPSNKLEVAGNIYANSGALISNIPSAEGGNLQLYNTSKTGATANNWVLFNMTGGYGNGLAFWRYYADGTNAGPSVWFGDNGNVGIGTRSPNTALEVGGRVTLLEGNRYWSVGGGRADGAGNGFPDGAAVVDGSFAVRDVWMQRDRLRIDSSGNVGIGTTNPTQKLSVAGTIRAYEVIVDTGWADYVFDSNYRLAPLSEVEQHIKAEKHLPGIPSAAEIAEHGVSMGDMQSKLLSKIEELTLHMIQQEKQQVEQQKQMIDQEKKLSARIERLEQENRELKTVSSSHL